MENNKIIDIQFLHSVGFNNEQASHIVNILKEFSELQAIVQNNNDPIISTRYTNTKNQILKRILKMYTTWVVSDCADDGDDRKQKTDLFLTTLYSLNLFA